MTIKDAKKIIEKNWIRVSAWMLASIILFESFTVIEHMAVRIGTRILSAILALIGIFISGEKLLDD